MSSLDFYQIKISRSKHIERDRNVARLRLNQHEFVVGEPVMVRYYLDKEQTEIDTLFALGIKNGTGEDCYKIISLGGLNIIRKVMDELPDVSLLVHGELYLCKNEDGVWSYIYEEDGVRKIKPISGGPFIFHCTDDNYKWYFRDGILKREDDFYIRSEIDKMISGWDANIKSALKTIEELKILVNKNNSSIFPLNIVFQDSKKQDKEIPIYKTGVKSNIDFVIKVTIPDINTTTGEVTKYDVTRNCEFELNNKKIDLPENNKYTVTGISETTEYRLTVKYTDPKTKIVRKSTSIYTVKFGYSFYYGQISNSGWEATEHNLSSLPFNVVGDENTTITFKGDLNFQKLVYAYPKKYGNLLNIFDYVSGLNYVTDYEVKTCMVDDVEYNVYIKEVPLKYEGFQQIYSFK